jgi:hypothetical protein
MLEFLALKWAVTDKFKDYLYGQQFTKSGDIAKHSTYVMELTELQMVRINSWSMSRLTLVSVGIRLKPSASALFFPGPIPYVECLAISPDLVKDDIDDATAGTSTSDIVDWKKTQEKDTRLH